jgi:hypothetical protein
MMITREIGVFIEQYLIINYDNEIGAAPGWIKSGERESRTVRPHRNCPLHAFEEEQRGYR